jgi:hypothetical protein
MSFDSKRDGKMSIRMTSICNSVPFDFEKVCQHIHPRQRKQKKNNKLEQLQRS